MSAPWSIELNEDFFVSVKDQILEGFSDNDFDWGVVIFWDLSWFQKLFNFTGLGSLEEWGEGFSGDFALIEKIFIVLGSKEENGWDVFSVDSQIFGESVEESVAIVFVGKGENDSFWVGGINGFQSFLGRFGLIVTICEEEQGWAFILENFLDSGVVEGEDGWVDVHGQNEW